MYNTKPTAKYVAKFAERQKKQWSTQRKLDDMEIALETLKNNFSVKADTIPVPLRAGIGGILVEEDAALLAVTPFAHVNPPTDDPKDESHASEVLEPWLAAALKRSQRRMKVWPRMRRTLVSLGRAFTFIAYDTTEWYDTDEYKKLAETQEKSEPESDERKSADKAIADYKRDNWPIVWRHVDTRNTYADMNTSRPVPEAVEIRKMTYAEIEDAYPGYLPESFKDKTDIEVLEYANWHYCATVIDCDKEEPAYIWEHHLGRNPFVLMEACFLPDGVENARWRPAMFYAQDLIKSFDTILSDLNTLHHEHGQRVVLQVFDKELYDDEGKVVARPTVLDWHDPKNRSVWKGEEPILAPVPEISAQSIFLVQMIEGLIRENVRRPVERGESKSGDSANKFVTQVQIAEREFDPLMEAINEFWEEACILHMRSVCAINYEFPNKPDKIAIYGAFASGSGKTVKRRIAVGPEDVRGWEPAIQAVSSRAIPIDGNTQVAIAQGKSNLNVPLSMIYEQDLGYEDPAQVARLYRREAMDNIVFEQVIGPWLVQTATTVFSQLSPEQQQEFSQAYTGASGTVQQVIAENGLAPSVPGSVDQSMANLRRVGVPQAPQTPDMEAIPGG